MESEHIPYQSVLRVIGRYLDRHHAEQTRIMETPHGFSIRYVLDLGSMNFVDADFSHETLRANARRGLLKPILRRPVGSLGVGRARLTYENFFRALGYELEEAGAFAMLLDEFDDGCHLSYQYLSPTSDFSLHKHRAVLVGNDPEEILRVAVTRRGRPGPTR